MIYWSVAMLFVVMTNVYCYNPLNSLTSRAQSSTRRFELASATTDTAAPQMTPPPPSIKDVDLDPRNFLNKILSSRSSKEEKKILLSKLQNLRMAGTKESNTPGTFNYAQFLDELLILIDSIQGNMWARRRLPIPLPSLRLKMGSAKRLMNTLIEKEGRGSNKEEGGPEMDSGKNRRALGILLNQLAQNDGGVRALELEALTRLSRNTMEEMLERTPKGLETPKYEVVYNKETFQVRKYDAFAVCSMMLMDLQQQNGPAGFQTLAGYIFGKNIGSQKMAMTTPVISSGNMMMGNNGNNGVVQPKKMSFVMPSAFWADNSALEGAPKPIEGSGIKLETNGGGMIVSTDTVAVLWFGGYATPSEISKRAGELLKQVEEDGTWKVKVCTVAFQCPYVCISITLLVLYVYVFTLLMYYVLVVLFF